MLVLLGNLPSMTVICTALLGGGLFGYGVYLVPTARARQRWPMVSGAIAESRNSWCSAWRS
jgi:hypothetical protein